MLSAVEKDKPELCFFQKNSGLGYQEDGEGSTFPHDRSIYRRTGRAADHLAAKTVLTCLQMQSALCLIDNEVYV